MSDLKTEDMTPVKTSFGGAAPTVASADHDPLYSKDPIPKDNHDLVDPESVLSFQGWGGGN